MRILLKLVVILLLAAIIPQKAGAQSNPSELSASNATGLIPYATYGGVRENINLMNGGLNLEIPLLSLPGRNGHDVNLSLMYDSMMWTLHGQWSSSDTIEYWWTYEEHHPRVGRLGWRLNLPYLYPTSIQNLYTTCTSFILATADGSKHSFSNRAACTSPSLNVNRTDAEDGSFMTLDSSNTSDVVVYMKNGTRHHFAGLYGYPSKIVDSNGNMVQILKVGDNSLKIIDTLNREVALNYSDYLQGTLNNISYKDSNG